MTSINDRIQIIIDTVYNGNKSMFAKAIGVTPSLVDGIVGKRQSAPSFKVLCDIYTIVNVNPDWLLLGDGNMFDNASKIQPSYEFKNNGHNIVGSSNNKIGSLNGIGTDNSEISSNLFELLKKKDEQIEKLLSIIEKLK